MSAFWSWWITLIALANILACVWLIRWTARKRPGEAAEHETTGHEWDGLQELNRPMPRWWLWLFYITIVFSLVYLVLYPGLGRFEGVLGWSQYSAWEDEVVTMEERTAPLFQEFAEIPIPELATNEEAMQTGRRLFGNNCAVCHGADGGGRVGFPNIANNSWQWGGTPEDIHKSILEGRQGFMPAFGSSLGEEGLEEVAAYVFHLSGREAPEDLIRRGEERFSNQCVACHGAGGEGNQAFGAPRLTDDNWTYGGGLESIKATIRDGRQGRMPPQRDLLGEDRVHVLAAFVYSLSMDQREDDTEAADPELSAGGDGDTVAGDRGDG